MLEEQGQGTIKDLLFKLLSKIGAAIKSGVDTAANKSIGKIYHKLAETGEVSEKKLIKLDDSVMPFGDPMDNDAAIAVAAELKKYNIAYAIKPMDNGKFQFIGHSKHLGNFDLAVQNAEKKQLEPKKSIKDNIYKQVKDKVQAKQSKEHSRQEPLKHNLRERG